jgi:hypothetical protein
MLVGLIIGAVIAGLWQIVGHWLPWNMLLGDGLARIGAYVWGVTGILLGVLVYSLIAVPVEQWHTLIVVTVMSVSAGICTVLAYLTDALGRWLHELRMRRQISDDEKDE